MEEEVRDKPSREPKQTYKQFLKFVKLLKTFESSIAVLCRGFLFLLVSACAFMVVILLFPIFCSHSGIIICSSSCLTGKEWEEFMSKMCLKIFFKEITIKTSLQKV